MVHNFRELSMIHKFFGFRGRIGRGTWWLAQVVGIPIVYIVGISLLVGLVAASPAQTAEDLNLAWGGAMILALVAAFIVGVWINFSSTIQRYHDRGKSGFWSLLLFVPFIGAMWVIIECGFCSGEDGSNQWGPPPGSERARQELEREIGALAAGEAGSKFAKLDDAYFQNYASQMKQNVAAPAATMTAQPSAASFGNRPAFGKR